MLTWPVAASYLVLMFSQMQFPDVEYRRADAERKRAMIKANQTISFFVAFTFESPLTRKVAAKSVSLDALLAYLTLDGSQLDGAR